MIPPPPAAEAAAPHSGGALIDSHIAELRRKLEPEPAQRRFILTVRKVGYRLDAG